MNKIDHTSVEGLQELINSFQRGDIVEYLDNCTLDGWIQITTYEQLVKSFLLAKVEFHVSVLRTYKIGETFKDQYDELHILAQVKACQVCFIGLDSGNRYSDPIEVKDVTCITAREIDLISNGMMTPVTIKIEKVRNK